MNQLPGENDVSEVICYVVWY